MTQYEILLLLAIDSGLIFLLLLSIVFVLNVVKKHVLNDARMHARKPYSMRVTEVAYKLGGGYRWEEAKTIVDREIELEKEFAETIRNQRDHDAYSYRSPIKTQTEC